MTITPTSARLTATMGLVIFPEVSSSVQARGSAAIMVVPAIMDARAIGPASLVADLATSDAVDSVVAALLGADRAEVTSAAATDMEVIQVVASAVEAVSRAVVALVAEVVSRVEVAPAAEAVSRAVVAPMVAARMVADAGKFHR
jgi:hypothetical protein